MLISLKSRSKVKMRKFDLLSDGKGKRFALLSLLLPQLIITLDRQYTCFNVKLILKKGMKETKVVPKDIGIVSPYKVCSSSRVHCATSRILKLEPPSLIRDARK